MGDAQTPRQADDLIKMAAAQQQEKPETAILASLFERMDAAEARLEALVKTLSDIRGDMQAASESRRQILDKVLQRHDEYARMALDSNTTIEARHTLQTTIIPEWVKVVVAVAAALNQP